MSYEIFSTNAPLSAEGSAAQQADASNDNFGTFTDLAEEEYVKPKFRMVAGGIPVIERVFDEDDYPDIVRASDSDDEDWFDSARAFEARLEARMDNGYGGSKAPFLTVVENGKSESKPKEGRGKSNRGRRRTDNGQTRYPGLKKLTEKQ